jgi:hypothetical protein
VGLCRLQLIIIEEVEVESALPPHASSASAAAVPVGVSLYRCVSLFAGPYCWRIVYLSLGDISDKDQMSQIGSLF